MPYNIHKAGVPLIECHFVAAKPFFLASHTQAFYICSYLNYTIVSVVYWSEFLATDPEVWVQFLVLPDFLSGSGTGSTQPCEYT
jgi:hypothetical protein